jgi:uncharacterized coiled-coil protein SlyX
MSNSEKAMEHQLCDLESQLEDTDQRLADKEAEYKAKSQQCIELVDEIDAQVQKNKELEKEVKKIKELQTRVKKLENIEALSSIKDHEERIDEIETKVKKFKDHEDRIDELEKELESIDALSSIEDHEERIDELETKVAKSKDHEDRIDELEKDADAFRSQIRKLQDQLQELVDGTKKPRPAASPKTKKRKVGATSSSSSSSSSSKKENLDQGHEEDIDDEEDEDEKSHKIGSPDPQEKMEYLACIYQSFLPGFTPNSSMVQRLISFIGAHEQWFSPQRFSGGVPFYFAKFAERAKAALSDIKLHIENISKCRDRANDRVNELLCDAQIRASQKRKY